MSEVPLVDNNLGTATYPGRMLTYPGFNRGQPPVFVHDCVQVKTFYNFALKLAHSGAAKPHPFCCFYSILHFLSYFLPRPLPLPASVTGQMLGFNIYIY